MVRLTPMMEQFKLIKAQYTDAILFFRVGDFYEMFFEDALTASRELDIALTSRDGNKKEGVPLAGIPWHSANTYIAKLLNKGYKVAICEQAEDSAEARGLVKREVTRVITPGTRYEDYLLQQDKNNYLCFLSMLKNKSIGVTFVEISTGEVHVFCFNGDGAEQNVIDEIFRFQPAELLINDLASTDTNLQKIFKKNGINNFSKKTSSLDLNKAIAILEKQFSPDSLAKWKIDTFPAAAVSAAAALQYLQEVQKNPLKHIREINLHIYNNSVFLDAVTLYNLEILETLQTRDKKNSLFGVLNRTKTSMGGRLLRKWLERPLFKIEEIEQRWDAVEELKNNQLFREELADYFTEINDLERLCSRLNFGAVNPRDFLSLKKSLQLMPQIANKLKQAKTKLLQSLGKDLPSFSSLVDELEQSIAEEAPYSLREGGIFKEGFCAEIDELRSLMRNSKKWLLELEKKERERSGIKSLKIRYNKIFGYYIEITKANLGLVPHEYIRKQTLVNAERYITEELKEKENIILGAEEKLSRLEFKLFEEMRIRLTGYIASLQHCARIIATLDCLVSLSDVAAMRGYCRPRISDQPLIRIKGGRHPVVERTLTTPFVPNDLFLDSKDNRVLIVTGPNMAGKSTYCRSAALLVLMAQAGSFVPADEMEFSPVERIFARVGASDNLSGGRSTFMVEMEETASIISNASSRSLVVLDEIGRGTSTYDGISLARAVLEYLYAETGSMVLFSTHFHELTALEDELTAVKNLSVTVQETEEGITFLYRVIPGRASRSYGINVARLARLPSSVISRAEQILTQLEEQRHEHSKFVTANGEKTGHSVNSNILPEEIALCLENSGQLSIFKPKPKDIEILNYERMVIEEIKSLNLTNMTPLKALNKLFSLQVRLIKKENTTREKEN